MSKTTFAPLNSAASKDRHKPTMGKAKYISESYKGLSPVQVAKKAANKASNNGECWWVYKYVYTNLMYRGN